ncbi:co-regulatory protein PtrA N-terminal domain-containing protein [Pseudomonas sp. GWSMS-1]|uniref:co-regulatory protein PtrA N-terminal domain-containing protein n=1 Tax=Pseudomonas sp. GWSMS-1 TaxID=3308997 RepID=UPI003CEF81B6
MKSLKTLLVLAALSVSSLAMAEGGADRTFARMEKARAVSMQAFQAAKQEQADASVKTEQSNG